MMDNNNIDKEWLQIDSKANLCHLRGEMKRKSWVQMNYYQTCQLQFMIFQGNKMMQAK